MKKHLNGHQIYRVWVRGQSRRPGKAAEVALEFELSSRQVFRIWKMAASQFGETEVTRRLVAGYFDKWVLAQRSKVGSQEIQAFIERGFVTAKDLQALAVEVSVEAWRGK